MSWSPKDLVLLYLLSLSIARAQFRLSALHFTALSFGVLHYRPSLSLATLHQIAALRRKAAFYALKDNAI